MKPSSFHESNKRDSNVSGSTELLNSGFSSNEFENPSILKNGYKWNLAVNRGSQIVTHSGFMRKTLKNFTCCPEILKKRSLSTNEDKEDIYKTTNNSKKFKEEKQVHEDKEKGAFVKKLLRNNMMKEYENRIKSFMKNEKFFLCDIKNLKINIPFPYIEKQGKQKDSDLYKALTERKSKSLGKNRGIFWVFKRNLSGF